MKKFGGASSKEGTESASLVGIGLKVSLFDRLGQEVLARQIRTLIEI